ncbi:DUF3987 domain-containing protein [Pedobacter gandavensis]|uniref:DUF3987 domain-containing protein n=1 Tax=Pedobacter gandavensis TaxID=2679963 RepID=A0ABR6EVB8_9SPHI|nr:DUF3987 domain-containing protein [Pedobacter gandavensis]MBB2149152.1 DUF3987 domain-containing protein [Pedobacter gandavensis]
MGFNDFLINNKSSEVSTASTEDIVKELRKREGPQNIFPLEIFNSKIKPFINELHVQYDIPRSYIGLSMLLSYSTAIGTAFAVSRNGSDRMYLSLWGCMNGISSSGKSYALDMCLKPLNDIQDEFDEEWDEKTESMTDERRMAMKLHTIIYRDAYIPTLIRYIMPVNPKGVLKESDEILEWINGLNAMGKKESTDEQFWLSAWNGRKYSAVRSSNVKINIPRVFSNVIGGIQPKLLYKLFKNERGDSGFIFRVLFACPEEYKIARPVPGYDIPIEYKEMHKKHLEKLYKCLPVENGYQEPKICTVTKEALKLIGEWESKKINMINNIPDVNEMNIHSGILGKMKEYTYRFAGILAITDYAYNMDHDQTYFKDEVPITADVMTRALKAANYFYTSAVAVYEAVDSSVTAPMNILYLATLFKMGKSISQMAGIILGDEKKKSTMQRTLKKAIHDYPKVFGAVNHQ